jgi:hypothetical protein
LLARGNKKERNKKNEKQFLPPSGAFLKLSSDYELKNGEKESLGGISL